MNEEFDDRLKSRITDVFDNFEDDSAQQGWLLLREKYPEKKKDRGAIWLWWGSAAAVLLCVLGLGLWINSNHAIKNNMAATKPAASSNSKTDNIVKGSARDTGINKQASITNNSIASKTTTNGVSTNVVALDTTSNIHIDRHPKKNVVSKRYLAYATKSKPHKAFADGYKSAKQNIDRTKTPVEDNESPVIASAESGKPQAKQPETKVIDSAVLADNAAAKTKPIEVIKPKDAKPPIFTALKPNDVKVDKKEDKKVKFGIYAATYFNYAKGSDNEFNIGGGLSYDIKITGNLRLVTGAVVGQNSFNYQSDFPQAAGKTLALSIAADSKKKIADPVAAANNLAAFSTSPANDPMVNTYNANLVAFDIPVNLKYQFNKSETYIAAGVSSGTYVETYKLTYNYSNAAGYSAAVPAQSTQLRNVFNTFDFARTLNIAFGLGYPLGKSNHIIIEPFLKYPLSGLGSQDIRFGAGGVNLKLNIQSPKK